MSVPLFFNNFRKNNRGIFLNLLCVVLISPLMFWCCNQLKPASEKPTGEWKTDFARKLPHDKPDVCLQLINDSLKQLDDQAWACENVMFNAFDAQGKAVYFQHLNNFERLTEGRFKGLGTTENRRFHAKIQFFRGYRYIETGQYDSAFFFLDKGLKVFEALKDSAYIQRTLVRTANAYAQSTNNVKAIDLMIQALRYIKEDDKTGRSDCLNELALFYSRSRNYVKAKEAAFDAIAVSKNTIDTPLLGLLYSNFAMHLISLKQGDSALWAVQKSYEFLSVNKSFDALMANCYLNFANTYRLLGKYDKCLTYAEASFRGFDSLGQRIYSAVALNAVANGYQAKGDWREAKNRYAKVLRALDSFPKPDLRAKIYDSLTVLTFQERGDSEGLRRFRESRDYTQTQFSTTRQQIVENMNVRYEMAQSNQKIDNLISDKKTLQLQAFIGLMAFVFALSLVGFFQFRNRQQRAILQKENELLAAQEKAAQLKLATNQEQLTTFTRNILSKNQLISDLEVRISQLTFQESTITTDENEFNRERLANMKILTDEDWKLYQKYFSEVHKEFVQRVERDLSDLTAGELRLCMLLKQGLDSKDMADVLGISLAGIKKNRHRLRKKLNLTEEDNLEAFVQAF